MNNKSKKKILIAPLNWGLGHTTRCIPIITALLKNDFEPILASDGDALKLLQLEFPHLKSFILPSYNITYPKNGKIRWHLLKQLPHILKTMNKEHRLVQEIIRQENISGIISDNRFGMFSKKIPSVYITHQLTILSGFTTFLSTYFHQKIISNFNECWVPDAEDKPNLTGKLGHLKDSALNIKYIGVLSRLEKKVLPIKYNLMVILSGPEPQRTFLEEKLISALKNYEEKVVFISGKIESEQKKEQIGNVTFYNFMQTDELEKTFNESKFVLCRSGYTTVMDLAKLEKKAFFIPTPGQFEQEFLAKKYKREGIFPMAKQDDFKISNLDELPNYSGFKVQTNQINLNLFDVFI